MTDGPRFVRTDKVRHGDVFYAVNVTSHSKEFRTNWRCLRCNESETLEEGYPTADEAATFAKDRIAAHHRLHHP